MSYAHHDHARWVEAEIAGLKRTRTKLRGNLKEAPDKLSPFQARVCDILGMALGGAHNAPINWANVNWQWGAGVSVVVGRTMSTHDFREMTMLVLLCHEARIRCEVKGAGPNLLRLSFSQRKAEGGDCIAHPNIDEALERFHQYLPADHRIIWREPTP